MSEPRLKLLLVGCVGLLAVTLERPGSLALLALAGAVALIRVPASRPYWGRGALVVGAAVWGTVLSQGLFYAEHPRVALLSVGPLSLYREGALYGLVQSLRMIAVSLAGLGLVVSTPRDQLLRGLMGLGLPSGLAFMVMTALHFLPDTVREALEVRRARARRGRPVWQRSPWAWLALELSLLRPVVARLIRRARTLAESLDARGFDPLRVEARAPWGGSPGAWALTLAACAGTALLVGARLIFLAYTSGLAWFPALRPLYGWVRAWM
ncbi:MAG: hypothetical protein JXX28_01315 [Deltaproteobacteria bacterium]|nr:hypothetical protein [Deltaproteobacteria bacterium]